jgi:hypothetical protein
LQLLETRQLVDEVDALGTAWKLSSRSVQKLKTANHGQIWHEKADF